MEVWCVHDTNQFPLPDPSRNPLELISNLKEVFTANKIYFKDCDGIYIIIQTAEDYKEMLTQNPKAIYIGEKAKSIPLNEKAMYSTFHGICSICNNLITEKAQIMSCKHKAHIHCILFKGRCSKCTIKCQRCGNLIETANMVQHGIWHSEYDKLNENLKKKEAMEDDDNMCVICLMRIEKSMRHFLPCSHFFHKECIMKWLEKDRNCPNCRLNPDELLAKFSNKFV